MIPLFDLHCDTLYELYKTKQNLNSNNLAISLEKASKFSPHIAIFSIWSEARLSDEEAYNQYKQILEYSKKLNIKFATTSSKLSQQSFILGVEDARILNNDISRLQELYIDGVRVLTLSWKWASSIGGGWNTSFPLTAFGKEVVKECIRCGIILDISHSSRISASEVLDLCEASNTPLMASHSNAYSICNHPRNLDDNTFKRLVDLNSVIGINFVPKHLSCSSKCTISDILRHIEHFLRLGGENNICIGSDFDGTASLPNGIKDISSIDELFYSMEKAFSRQIATKIFFENAFRFTSKNL